jgi:hypothetical protein
LHLLLGKVLADLVDDVGHAACAIGGKMEVAFLNKADPDVVSGPIAQNNVFRSTQSENLSVWST